MTRIPVILNPAAHSEKAGDLENTIRALSPGIDVWVTSGPGEAGKLAKHAVAEGFNTIVAAGGDGTVNEVVNGIAGSDVTLGLLPVGTMNVFAAELGLPCGNLRKCWEIIHNGKIRHVDLPRANNQYFVQLGGIGFDAQVVQETSWDFKKNFGPLSYIISAAQIAGRKPPPLTLEADGKIHEGSFILIGNGRYYGGPFVIFKDAKIDDGKLDVLIFKNLSYIDIIRYLHGIIFGRHVNFHDVEYFQTSAATVRSENEVPVELDGEVVGNLPVEFSLSPHKLRVLVS